LNELGDVVSDAALYLPFALLPEVSAAAVVAMVLLAVISEMAGIMGQVIGSNRRYDGPMGKSDRAFIFGALALWMGAGGPVSTQVAYVFPRLVALLLAVTIVNRVRKGLAEANA